MREIRIGGLSQSICWKIKKKADLIAGYGFSITYRNYGKRCDLLIHTYRTYHTDLEFFQDVVNMLHTALEGDRKSSDKKESCHVFDIENLDLGL